MCGRFALYSSLSEIKKHFRIDSAACEVLPSYNIAPSEQVYAIIGRDGRRLGRFSWGLAAGRAGAAPDSGCIINARLETLRVKPSFNKLIAQRRCAILADGFYEWRKDGSGKQAFYIMPRAGGPFAFAGLWDGGPQPDGSLRFSCVIITMEAATQISHIHHRMPAILQSGSIDRWLDPNMLGCGEIERIILEGHQGDFLARPVSPHVNFPGNKTARCIEAAALIEYG